MKERTSMEIFLYSLFINITLLMFSLLYSKTFDFDANFLLFFFLTNQKQWHCKVLHVAVFATCRNMLQTQWCSVKLACLKQQNLWNSQVRIQQHCWFIQIVRSVYFVLYTADSIMTTKLNFERKMVTDDDAFYR